MKTTETVGPVLIHIITQKGKGYLPAETASDKMHGVGPYNPKDGKSISKPSSKPKVLLCPVCFATRSVCATTSSEWDVACVLVTCLQSYSSKEEVKVRVTESYECAACICCAMEKKPSVCVKTHLLVLASVLV